MKQSPFKFLDPYEKKDKDIFFGRDKEVESLYEMTFKTNLLLIYGQSGTGKTSLIQCGLANRFRESDWFDLYIRRGDNINDSLKREITSKAETPIEPGISVVEGIQSLYLDFLKPVYLIFDQFEELFILGSNSERQDFFETIKQLLTAFSREKNQSRKVQGIPCKILFIMREEYIARLYDFEKVVPQLFNHRFRVEPMPLSEVEAVIKHSCKTFGIDFIDQENTIKEIVESNRDEQGMIRLPYLQVYLDRLYRETEKHMELEKTGKIVFTPEGVDRIGKISDVMASFLDEQTDSVQAQLKEKFPDVPDDCVWQVLNCFVTVEGTNLPLEKEVIYKRLKVKLDILNVCLIILEKSRILRPSENQRTYEIAHDALAFRIDKKRSVEEKTLLDLERLVKSRFNSYKNTKEFLAKGDLNYIKPYETKLRSKLEAKEIDFIEKSKLIASFKRQSLITITISIFIILSTFAIFTWDKWKVAEKKTKEANAHRLAVIAESVVKDDSTLALRIAEKALQLDSNPTVNETILRIYRENSFYRTIAKHTSAISSVAFSPDGKTILTGSWDNTARLWDLQGKMIQEFKGHSAYVSSVAFSPDGKTILTGSDDKTARLWDLKGNTLQEFKGHTDNVTSVAFSPNGKTILTGSLIGPAILWNLQGKIIQKYKGDNYNPGITSIAFSRDGKFILTGSLIGPAILWNLQGKTIQEFNGHTNWVNSVAFSPDGRFILTGSKDKTARLWDLKGKMIQEFKGHADGVRSVAFSPDGKTILTGSMDNTARLWDLKGNTIEAFKGHTGSVSSVAFSPNGKTVLTGSGDYTARLWDILERSVESFNLNTISVTSIVFSPDGKTIIACSYDNTVNLWDLKGNLIQEFKGHTGWVNSVAFSPDGRFILTGSEDKTARLWNLQGKTIQEFKGHTDDISSVAFSPDGKTILTGSLDNTARLWNLQGKAIHEFKDDTNWVNSVAFSPDGRFILTGSLDNTARLWDLKGNIIQEFKGHSGSVDFVAFSPDGKFILTGSNDETARLWDLKGNTIQEFKGHTDWVNYVTFSPDGRFIFTGSEDKTARLWDLHGNTQQELKGLNYDITSVVFSPDGKAIITGTDDHTVRLWKIMPLNEFLKKGNLEPLTPEQKKKYGIEE